MFLRLFKLFVSLCFGLVVWLFVGVFCWFVSFGCPLLRLVVCLFVVRILCLLVFVCLVVQWFVCFVLFG